MNTPQKRWYARNREHVAVTRRLRKYNITKEQFDAMFAAQSGLCAICGDDLLNGRYGVCVDHNHVTGKVRGLLCHPCNRGLGQFRDRLDLLANAAEYLNR